MPSAVSRAFEPGSRKTARPGDGRPSSRAERVLVPGPQFGPADVPEVGDFPVRAGLENDVGELLGLDQPAEGAQGVLEVLALGDRRLADLPGRHLHVLLAQDPDHVADRQVPRLQLVRVQPDAHAVVLLAEDDHVADALHPGHGVLELDRGVIAQVERVVIRPAGLRVVLGIQADPQQDVRGPFLDGHADGPDHVGQRRLGDGDAVLHQHLGHVHVGAQLEGHVQGVRAVVVALRRHVQHPFHADDLLLDRRGHRVGHDLGVGPGVAGRHPDGRRRDLRVLGDRQEARRDGPEQDDHDGDHPRQDRAVDEETRQHDSSPFRRSQDRGWNRSGVGRHVPFRSIPASSRHVHELRLDGDARPHLLQAVDDHPLARLQAVGDLPQAVVERPQPDGAGDHLVLLVDDVEDLLALVGVDGAVGDQQGLVGRGRWAHGRGRKSRGRAPRPCWGTRPGRRRVPVFGLTWLSTKLIVPWWGNPPRWPGRAHTGHSAVAGRLGLAFADQLPDAQHRVLVHVEVGVHRVHRHDGGEQGAAVLVPRLDQVAHRDDVSADAAADRRGDLRVLQVQRGAGRGRPWRHARLATASRVIALVPVIFFLADRPACDQVLGAAGSPLQSTARWASILRDGCPWPGSSSAWYGRGSISKSTSPFLTSAPSLKLTLSR